MAGYFLDSIVFSLIAFGLFGLLAAPITIIFQTTLQEAIPVNILGSAMGVLSSGATIAQPIGVFLLGGVLLLKLDGATVLTITCAFSIIAVSIGWWRLRLQQMQSQNSSEPIIQKVNSPSA
jgi:MFS transporter, DHA3 family, macrolide efflux protein